MGLPLAMIDKLRSHGLPEEDIEVINDGYSPAAPFKSSPQKRAYNRDRMRLIRDNSDNSCHVVSADNVVELSTTSTTGVSLLKKEDILKERKREAHKRGVRLSPDWLPSPATCEAMRLDCGVEGDGMTATLKRFRDYWIAIPGQKGCKLDWDATLRNWIRKDCDKNTPASVSSEERYKRAVEAYRSGGPLNGAAR